ncbi:hypothetical protein B0H11DRAFT_2191799 [Mycena galericulata]|nr:hypothetical protein B0H11DRAFT_2191799 [Mycena galericulata]
MEDPDFVPNVRPKRILVIGGGASGLVTLRNLRERGKFDDVQLVERRNDVGGVWYLDEDVSVPNARAASGAPRWPSPAYPGLIGNVLPEFLSFSAFPPFPEPTSTTAGQPFPSLTETHAYLRAFSAPLIDSGAIRLNTEVLAVEELPARAGWRVRMRRWRGRSSDPTNTVPDVEALEEIWDAVVVAVACYDHPVFPTTPGLARLRELDLARHAQGWRGPQGYEGKARTLLTSSRPIKADAGAACPGNDIAAQLAPVARAVYQSIRRPNFPGFPSLPDARITRVAPVAEYVLPGESEAKGGAHALAFDARLADGTTIPDLDGVLLGTGYRASPSFLHVLRPNPTLGSDGPHLAALIPPAPVPATYIPHLHRYTLYAPNPALAFVGTAFASYTPFTLADVCSSWLALAWAGALAYPTDLRTLLEFERERLRAVEEARVEMERAMEMEGEGGGESADAAAGLSAGKETGTKAEASALVAYGVLGPFEEAYASALRAEVVSARPELDAVLPVWNPERTAAREAMFSVKRRALELARAKEMKGGDREDAESRG